MWNRAVLGLWEASSTASTRSLVVTKLVERSLGQRIMPGEHSDSGWSVVRPTGSASLVQLAVAPDDGR